VVLVVKKPPASVRDTRDMGLIPVSGRSPGGGSATRSNMRAWRIPWTEEPGRLQSMGSQRVRMTEATFIFTSRSYTQGPARDIHWLGGYISPRIWGRKETSPWELGECRCQAWIWPPGRPRPHSLRPRCERTQCPLVPLRHSLPPAVRSPT